MNKKHKLKHTVKAALLNEEKDRVLTSKDFVSTGSTLLNLAITGHSNRGFAKGQYFHFVGDSESGKTWICLTCFAEAANNPNFANHRLIYDNVEGGALMSIRRFFGSKVADKIEPPRIADGMPAHSYLVEDFYYNVDDALKDGRPFIYVLDSMDGLTSLAEEHKFEENKKAHRKGQKETGSYGMSKAAANSGKMHHIIGKLKKSDSILIVISQTRDNIGPMAMGGKTSSGGHALKFYAAAQLWASVRELIEKQVKGKKRQLGKLAKIRIKKNRITGRDRTIYVPFYHSYGIDDVGACVDYLMDEDHWQEVKGGIAAPEFEFTGKREALIKHIEEGTYEADLRELVGKVWNEIEKACMLDRKPRYE